LWNLTVVPLRKAGWESARGQLSDAIISADLRANLSAGNDAFRQMRYIYEPQQAKQICFFLYDLPMVLRFVILERKPGWARGGRAGSLRETWGCAIRLSFQAFQAQTLAARLNRPLT
jgi:hypothetical protein